MLGKRTSSVLLVAAIVQTLALPILVPVTAETWQALASAEFILGCICGVELWWQDRKVLAVIMVLIGVYSAFVTVAMQPAPVRKMHNQTAPMK